MSFPSLFGGMECADLDIGDLPPYIHKVKVVNKDMRELLTADIDVEYSGAVSFTLKVRQSECGESSLHTNLELNSGSEMKLDHPKELENNAVQMEVVSDNLGDGAESKDNESTIDEPEQLKSTTCRSVGMSMWNAVKHSIADHVLQVPLSVSVKVSSFSGKMCSHIKPPPSDQLWFGFTSMPEINWNIESIVGEQRINIGGVLFKNLLERTIRESLVYPQCECMCIPWMLDEKDNWLQVTEAPFQWVNQETFVDKIEPNQEMSMDMTRLNQENLDATELIVSETDRSHEATPSQVDLSISSSQLCGTSNKHT